MNKLGLLERLRTEKSIYTVLVAIIIATIPCYCMGFVALAIRAPATPTVTPVVDARRSPELILFRRDPEPDRVSLQPLADPAATGLAVRREAGDRFSHGLGRVEFSGNLSAAHPRLTTLCLL